MILLTFLLVLVSYVGIWKVYSQAGYPGIVAFIPIINFWFLFPIAGLSALMFFLLFIPIANLVVVFILFVQLAKKFNRGILFGIGLFVLPFIFFPLLGFAGKYQK